MASPTYSLVLPQPAEIIPTQWDTLFAAWQQRLKPEYEGVIVVSFVSRPQMRQVALTSLGESKVTDVLSFRYDEVASPDSLATQAAGEIVICPAEARVYATTHHLSVSRELNTLFVHGLLHLSDLDHATVAERTAFESHTHAIMEVINQEPASLWLAS